MNCHIVNKRIQKIMKLLLRILVTEWNEFKELDLKKIKDLANGNVFIDGRNVFEYYWIGRRDAEYYNDFLKEVALTIDEN